MRIKKKKHSAFGEKIIELRQQNNMTQKYLAEKLGFERTTIYSWERKGKEPSYATLIKLSKFFGVTVDYLLGNEDI